jgi:uncharacterized protein (DUF983 family)
MCARPSVPATAPQELQLARLFRHLGRALLRRCPNCGARGLFELWLVMRESCPRCDLRFDRGEDDYFIGSFTINFVVAELLICAGALIGILATWPDVPWTALKWTLIAFMIPTPALFYPFAKTIWLGIDLTFRPLRLQDLAGHGENIPDGDEATPPPPPPPPPPAEVTPRPPS